MREGVLQQKIERDELVKKQYIPREGIVAARERMNDPLIKVITGPRRSGKSVFAIQLLEGTNFGYLNFDDERLLGEKDYERFIKTIREVYGDTKYLLFDEIQNLPGWELFVNRLHRRGLNLVLTGSNSRLLSRELATHLTGRYIPFQILPFSFREFLMAKEFSPGDKLLSKESQGLVLNQLDEYMRTGGYPEVVVKGIEAKSYLGTLFEGILFRDVVKRYNVRYSKKLHDLGLYFVTNHSKEFTYTSLKKALAFRSTHTVENYEDYLEEAFLLFTVQRYSPKVKEQMKSPQKVFAYDTGLINAVKFKLTPDTGRLLENLVAVELLRRGKEIYYFRTRDGKEVDFVVKEGLTIGQLLQVCFEVEDPQTRKRESSGLIKAAKETGCKKLAILTWDYESQEDSAPPIEFQPVWRWLLKQEE
jgi:predicted AAA+ superfamily ATPase